MGRDNDFEGKVIALTGGASGIGLAAAQIVHRRGASISIADIDQAALDNAKSLFQSHAPDRVYLTKLDVTDRRAVDSWITSTLQHFHRDRLDGAANCAGVIGKHHGTRNVEALEDDQWDLILGVNLTGMMYSLRAELNAIKGEGSVVCVGSVQGVMGFAGHAAYSASKHGMLGLVRSAAKEVGGRGVRVNTVCPGSVDTPLMDKRNALEGVEPTVIDTPIQRMANTEEIGNLIAFLLSDESKFISGATYSIDGAWAC